MNEKNQSYSPSEDFMLLIDTTLKNNQDMDEDSNVLKNLKKQLILYNKLMDNYEVKIEKYANDLNNLQLDIKNNAEPDKQAMHRLIAYASLVVTQHKYTIGIKKSYVQEYLNGIYMFESIRQNNGSLQEGTGLMDKIGIHLEHFVNSIRGSQTTSEGIEEKIGEAKSLIDKELPNLVYPVDNISTDLEIKLKEELDRKYVQTKKIVEHYIKE